LDQLSNEPNATARSNGIYLLDEYVRTKFLPVRQFGKYLVLVRRSQ